MTDPLQRLQPNERRGSKPRCHWLTHGDPEQVAARLTALAEPWACVSSADHWMPDGFANTTEPQLHLATPLLSADTQRTLGQWWLPPDRQEARTPNFDLASTCTIEGGRGLLLVEAKAYDHELKKAAVGRPLPPGSTEERRACHETIGKALEEARRGLSDATSLAWAISRDTHYQMSNRFAWLWKVADLGVPVVLVYLGFLRATEMEDRGTPLANHAEWDALVKGHSARLFPDQVWNRRWLVNGVPFIPLIRSIEQPLNPEASP